MIYALLLTVSTVKPCVKKTEKLITEIKKLIEVKKTGFLFAKIIMNCSIRNEIVHFQ